MKTTPKNYRVVDNSEGWLSGCRYKVLKRDGSWWGLMTYTGSKWGAKLEIKRDKRRSAAKGNVVFETE